MKVTASNVGKVVKTTGMPKATAYHPFAARDVDGYIVSGRYDGSVQVMSTIQGDAGEEMLQTILDALLEKGFNAHWDGNRIGRYIRSVKVEKEEA